MDYFTNIIDIIFNFKPYVMLPIIILILSLIIKMKISKAILGALKLGVGFAGIFIVFEFFVSIIKPAANAVVIERGLNFTVLDVGWPPLAAITWTSQIAPLTIPLIIIINIIMLATSTTRTIYIDIWNYWHFALLGILIQNLTGSFLTGLFATALIGILTIKLSEWNGPYVERECGFKDICISPLSVNWTLPLGIAGNKLIKKIPLVKRLNFNPENGKKNYGVLGEPMMIGFFVGIFLGILAGYSVKNILELSIHIGAVMFILPKCAGLIGEGMQPVAVKLKNKIQQKFPEKKHLFISMDSGIIMQNSSVIVTGIILIPVSLALGFIIPGNKMIPLGDLANLISVMSILTLATGGNVIRAVIIGIPVISSYILIASHMAPLFTRLYNQVDAGLDIEYNGLISSFTDGGNPVRFWFYYLFQGNIFAMAVIPVVLFLLYITWKKYNEFEF
ncbi:MAG: PTS transporter subunit IIC [Halanaerobiaceae bacterium]